MTFVAAVALVAVLDLLLYRTGIGAKIRAVSDDVAAANLIGLSSVRIYAVAMGITFVTIGIAAGFVSIWTNFDPASGPTRLLVAFEVIVMGGLGSLWGSLAGGIVLGVAQAIGGQFDIAWQIMAGHIVFLDRAGAAPAGPVSEVLSHGADRSSSMVRVRSSQSRRCDGGGAVLV